MTIPIQYEKPILAASFLICVAILATLFVKNYFRRYWKVLGIFGKLSGITALIMIAPIPFVIAGNFAIGKFDWLSGWIAPWAFLSLLFRSIEHVQKGVIYMGRRGLFTILFVKKMPLNTKLLCRELRRSEHPDVFSMEIAFELVSALAILLYILWELRLQFGANL